MREPSPRSGVRPLWGDRRGDYLETSLGGASGVPGSCPPLVISYLTGGSGIFSLVCHFRMLGERSIAATYSQLCYAYQVS